MRNREWSKSQELCREYPLAAEFLAVTQVWLDDAGRQVVACKGAPEAVLAACSLTEDERREIQEAAGKYGCWRHAPAGGSESFLERARTVGAGQKLSFDFCRAGRLA